MIGKVILAIDSSTSITSVALAYGEEVIERHSHSNLPNRTSELALFVEELFENAQISAKDLTDIVFGSGPGSFTGLRIGLAFAKGLAFPYLIPISSLSSLQGAAAALFLKERPTIPWEVRVAFDARREEVFFASYRFDDDAYARELVPPKIVSMSELDRGAAAVWITDGAVSLPGVESRQTPVIAPGLLALFSNIAAERMVGTIESIANIEPTYLRRVSAKTIAEREADRS